jgi:hypothetical protein
VKAGHAYVDVGTLHGYRAAIRLLGDEQQRDGTARLGLLPGRNPDRQPAAVPLEPAE